MVIRQTSTRRCLNHSEALRVDCVASASMVFGGQSHPQAPARYAPSLAAIFGSCHVCPPVQRAHRRRDALARPQLLTLAFVSHPVASALLQIPEETLEALA